MSAPSADWPRVSFPCFQLLAHWGNRRTPRPAPRADVLAAALALAHAGEASPAAGLARLAAQSPYAAELVAALRGWPAPADGPSWRGLVTAEAHAANLRLLGQGLALASTLLAGAARDAGIGLEGDLQVRWVDAATCRVHPWPLTGRRLAVRAWDPRGGAWQRWTLLPLGAG